MEEHAPVVEGTYRHPTMKRRVATHAAWVAPLLTALAALAHDYISSIHHERQSTMMLQAVGSKLNALANEVAYIQGALHLPPSGMGQYNGVGEGYTPELYESAPKFMGVTIPGAGAGAVAEVSKHKPTTAPATPASAPVLKTSVSLKAFEAVPTSFEQLEKLDIAPAKTVAKSDPKGE
jgi:hypothetical protein